MKAVNKKRKEKQEKFLRKFKKEIEMLYPGRKRFNRWEIYHLENMKLGFYPTQSCPRD